MAGPMIGLLQGPKRVSDYQREEQEFMMRKQQAAQAKMLQDLQAQKLQKDIASGVATDDPAAVREWQFYSQMPPEQQSQYLQMKRADQILNLGGEMAVRNPMGGLQETYTVTPKITETPEYQGAQSGAQERAKLQEQLSYQPDIEAEKAAEKMRAEDLTQAQIGYGSASEKTKQALDLLNQIEQSPGLSAVVGMPNPMQGQIPFIGQVPGTPAADFQAKLNQLGGKQFLEAFESLKGGGQITQIEGEKATNAIARMQTSQSEAEFKKSLAEFKDIIIRVDERARNKAQQGQPTGNKIRIINDTTGEILMIDESDFGAAQAEGFKRL